MAKLTNKDKQAIREALYQQIESIVVGSQDEYGYHADLRHISPKDIAEYCYKIIGLYPSYAKGQPKTGL